MLFEHAKMLNSDKEKNWKLASCMFRKQKINFSIFTNKLDFLLFMMPKYNCSL